MCYITVFAIPVKCYLAFVFFSRAVKMCRNDLLKLLKDFKGDALIYSRANVEIKRAVFVGIHTLVTHGAIDKCTEKR